MTRYKLALALSALALTACTPKPFTELLDGNLPHLNGQPCQECDGPDTQMRVQGVDGCFTTGSRYVELHQLEVEECR